MPYIEIFVDDPDIEVLQAGVDLEWPDTWSGAIKMAVEHMNNLLERSNGRKFIYSPLTWFEDSRDWDTLKQQHLASRTCKVCVAGAVIAGSLSKYAYCDLDQIMEVDVDIDPDDFPVDDRNKLQSLDYARKTSEHAGVFSEISYNIHAGLMRYHGLDPEDDTHISQINKVTTAFLEQREPRECRLTFLDLELLAILLEKEGL